MTPHAGTPRSYGYGKQSLNEDDIQAVMAVLQSDWLTQGPAVPAFEAGLCEALGCHYATALCNGTAALHLTALALGWAPGDIIITTPMSFVATANCILYAGAQPAFVDIDPRTYTIDVNKLEARIKAAREAGLAIRAVIGVDYAGHPCDWPALRWLADKYELQLVDDACHALGARIADEQLCAATYADAVICSFHPVKHITSGEGGAVFTNIAELDRQLKNLRSHGVTRDSGALEKNEGPWYYEMQALGYNYRLTDLQAALGLSQLGKLPHFLQRRRQIAAYYHRFFSSDGRFLTPYVKEEFAHAYHVFPLQINFDQLVLSKPQVFASLKKAGVHAQVHYIPIHLQPYYRKKYGYRQGDFPVAEQFYRNEISIPMYPALVQSDLEYITSAVMQAISDEVSDLCALQ